LLCEGTLNWHILEPIGNFQIDTDIIEYYNSNPNIYVKYIQFKKWDERGGPKPDWAEKDWVEDKCGPTSDLPIDKHSYRL